VKVGDLVHYPDAPIRTWDNEEPLNNGIVVGFDHEDDPIVYFPAKGKPAAYYMRDIEVLNESW
jgi:hypothetical protein